MKTRTLSGILLLIAAGCSHAPGLSNDGSTPDAGAGRDGGSTADDAGPGAADGATSHSGDGSVPDAGPQECRIGGVTYDAGAANPLNPCEVCDPAASESGWTDAPLGTACASDQVCRAGACSSGCAVDGSFFMPGDPNPSNACEQCDPSSSITSFSAIADGTSCAAGEVCTGGTCASGCFISGAFYAAGASSASNACLLCDPTQSTSQWSNAADGTTCAGSQMCASGVCGGCFIDGTSYTTGQGNPSNPCQHCDPSRAIDAWSAVSDGVGCSAYFNRVCMGGACVANDACGGCDLSRVCCDNRMGGYDCFDACSAY